MGLSYSASHPRAYFFFEPKDFEYIDGEFVEMNVTDTNVTN